MIKYTVLLCLILINLGCTSKLPATFKKCNRKRDDLDQCLSTAVADAVRQLGQPQSAIGLPSLEPLEIPSLTVGAGTGPVGFAQNFHNVKIKGLTKDFTLKAKMDTKENILNLEFVYADFRIEADYEIDGRILVLPIRGKGPGLLVLERVKLNFNFFLEEYEKKNKKHYRVTKSEMAIEPGSIQFTLSNLFDGDKALGDNINQVLNDNWKEVFADVKSGYESGLGQVISSLFQNLLDKVPISDLFDDK
ncbi:protein takeout-like [Tenebrio molitor]|uniref:protein takeout-like n=1 Tax=Tenebrio molitor TaxID=7067 RepID=UPI003624971A